MKKTYVLSSLLLCILVRVGSITFANQNDYAVLERQAQIKEYAGEKDDLASPVCPLKNERKNHGVKIKKNRFEMADGHGALFTYCFTDSYRYFCYTACIALYFAYRIGNQKEEKNTVFYCGTFYTAALCTL